MESEIPKEFLASSELKKQRLAFCNTCDRLNKLRQCKECFCFVDLKTMLSNQVCDLKKW